MNRFCNNNAVMSSDCGCGSRASSANGFGNALLCDAPVGMAYVPMQKFGTTYEPQKALMAGTIFPELDKPFTGKPRGCCR